MIHIDPEKDDASPSDVSAIIDATTLVSIRIDEVDAGPVRHLPHEDPHFELSRGVPAYAVVEDGSGLLVRLEHSLQIGAAPADESSDRTTITVFHLAAFECDRDLETSASAISAWIETNVYFMVYPYVRQFLTAITADMGLPPVVLGYMKRSELPFSTRDTTDDSRRDM